jgi:transcriptional regulator with XRE-family HTH domain
VSTLETTKPRRLHTRTCANRVATPFGDRLKAERIMRGMHLEDFAKRCGVTHTTISAYENRGSEPTLTIAARIAQVLDCTLDWLAGIEEQEAANV